jgi:thiamine transporter
MKNTKSLRLTESAIMLAFALILSFISIIRMPFGGRVTAFSMLPIIIIAYRYGVKWGLFTGFAFSLLQLVTDLDVFRGVTFWSVIAILFLDFFLAFTVLGMGGIFRKALHNQAMSLMLGTILACALRFICHVISGCTVWAGISIPTADAFIFSIAYNSAYMIPEMIITLIGAFYITQILNFRSENITRATVQANKSLTDTIFSAVVMAAVCGAIIFDALHVFSMIQTKDGFDITGIVNSNWLLMGIVSGSTLVLMAIYLVVSHMIKKPSAAK